MTRNIRLARTALLDIAYEDSGPPAGRPVLLLHGWPDDPSTWDGVRPVLHAAGFRTIAPWLRGFGPSCFLSADVMRSGQFTALAADLIALADALDLDRFSVIGHDWGGRTAYVAAALFPQRIEACAALGVGYSPPSPGPDLPLSQAQNYWYQWFMRTPQGQAQLEQQREAFCRFLWQSWMAEGMFQEEEFAEVTRSCRNPDWLKVTLHSYLHRWGDADSDPQYAELEERLRRSEDILVPGLVLHGASDTCNPPCTSAGSSKWFKAGLARVVLPGVGHFPQRETPSETAQLLSKWLRSVLE